MIRWRGHYRRYHKITPLGKVMIFFGIIFIVLGFLVLKMRPMIIQYAVNTVKFTGARTINQAVSKKIYEERANYQHLVELQRDNNSHVTALTTDMISINNMKTEILACVYDCFDTLEKTKLEIPIGNIIDEDFFAGKGPQLQVGIASLWSANAEFISAFSVAGINQTRHSMILEVTVKTRVLSAGGNRDVTIVSRFNITDTVIVGTVPESYTYIDDTESSLLGKINDYTDTTNQKPVDP